MTDTSATNPSHDQTPILAHVKHFFEKAPVHRLLGLQITSMDPQNVHLRLDMKNELIGDHVNGLIHGGIMTAVLDSTGGITLWLEIVRRLGLRSPEDIPKYLVTHTIDLRIDFFKPGRGTSFSSSGNVVNFGKRIAVVRTELCDDSNAVIAMGTGTYMMP